MLRWRLTMAPVLIGTFVGICWLDHRAGPRASYFWGFVALLALRCAWELGQLLRVRSFDLNVPLVQFCTVWVIWSSWVQPPLEILTGDVTSHVKTSVGMTAFYWARLAPLSHLSFMFAGSVLLLFLSGCVRYREPGKSMESLGAELLIVSYVGVLLGVTAQLRWVAGAELGYLALGSLVVATKCGDIGAYTLGRLFGKRKMVPSLSPGKTWMGAWGAVLGATVGSVAWFQFGSQMFAKPGQIPCEWWCSALLGAILGVVGLIGDLAESLIKRDVGAKDAPALIPGFGGLLDVLDSILYAGPVAYILWLVLPLAPR